MNPYTLSYAVFDKQKKAYERRAGALLTAATPACALRWNTIEEATKFVNDMVQFGYLNAADVAIHKVYLSWEVVDVTDLAVDAKLYPQD